MLLLPMTTQHTKGMMCELQGFCIFFRTLTVLLGFLPPGCCGAASDAPSSAHPMQEIEALIIFECGGQPVTRH